MHTLCKEICPRMCSVQEYHDHGPTKSCSCSKLIAQHAMQAALVSCAASPVTLLVISIADFSKHATPDVLRVMRDEVHSLTSHF